MEEEVEGFGGKEGRTTMCTRDVCTSTPVVHAMLFGERAFELGGLMNLNSESCLTTKYSQQLTPATPCILAATATMVQGTLGGISRSNAACRG
jgi:hypothetical protein